MVINRYTTHYFSISHSSKLLLLKKFFTIFFFYDVSYSLRNYVVLYIISYVMEVFVYYCII